MTVRDQRPRRTFLLDPRFVIGIVLVVASVAGVYAIVASVDDTTEVFAARSTMTAGDRIDRGDLVVRSVRLGGAGEKYLTSADVPDDGLVVTRSVLAGELVPRSAVGGADASGQTVVVVAVDGDLPERVVEGSIVDLWAATAVEGGRFGPPGVLVSGATVSRVDSSDGLVAGGRDGSIELLVPRAAVAEVLEAIANDDALSVVPGKG